MTGTNRIILNMAALYGRVVITTVLALISSRMVLAALGVVDFGLYSVIVGIMGFMAFLNGAMATSSSRHLTHSLGRGDLSEINRIFKTAFLLHAALALLLILLGESVGLWFLNHVLNIPDGRRDAAFWIYQFSVFSTACYAISVPYQALLTAHEALVVASGISIIQAALTFTLALCILHIPGDHLIAFVFYSSLIAISMTVAQIVLCRVRYPESRLMTHHKLNWRLTGELLGFSGWSLVGSLSVVGRLQGVAFLLNIYFGPVVNAAYGIANQVSSMMSSLTQALQQAVTPRLIKQEGSGNRERMLELSLLTSKYGFFIACFWGIPLFAEMPAVLSLWLKNPPEHATVFCRIILLMFVCDQLSSGLGAVVLAIGNMARYQTVVGVIHLSSLPLAYVFLQIGFDQTSVLLCSLGTVVAASIARSVVVRKMVRLSLCDWVNRVVIRGLAGILPSAICTVLLIRIMPPSVGRLVVLSASSGVIAIMGAYYFGMSDSERERLKLVGQPLFARIVRKRSK